ncbi:MAG: Tfp pilus assembly protein PilF [Kiritimatiellia bacterium]|jgi:Tfp pilus assembly protein PilF
MDSANYLQRAHACMQLGRHREALGMLHQVLVIEPDSGTTFSLIALCHCALDALDAAEEAARRSVGLTPDDDFAHHVMAQVHAQRLRLVVARKSILEALRLDPTDPDHWELRARIEWMQHQRDDSVSSARKGLSFDPTHEGCLDILARSLLDLGEVDAAAVVVRDALQANPADPDFMVRHGELLLVQGKLEAAREAFSDALTQRPGMTGAQDGLADTLRAKHPVYRRLLPLLLKTRPLFEGEPVISRVIVVLAWAVCLGLAPHWPVGLPFTLPVLVALGGLAFALVLAEPALNALLFLHQKDRHALSIGQRFGVLVSGLSLVWLMLVVGWLIGHGLHHRMTLAVIALQAPVLPLSLALADRFNDYDRRRMFVLCGVLLLSLCGMLGVLWLGGFGTPGPRFFVAMGLILTGWILPVEQLKRGPCS